MVVVFKPAPTESSGKKQLEKNQAAATVTALLAKVIYVLGRYVVAHCLQLVERASRCNLQEARYNST